MPKCHAKIAGKGVEYMWAFAKGTYQSLALKEKKGKWNFNHKREKVVGKCDNDRANHEIL